jgi:hypothetical protein
MGRLSRILLLLAVVSMASGTFAAAEPIVITSGTVALPHGIFDPVHPVALSGSDGVRPFTFSGDIDGGNSNLAAYTCRPCVEGTAQLSIDIAAFGTVYGDVTYGSESYVTGSGTGNSPDQGLLSMEIVGSVSLPALLAAPGEVVTITTPFTMTGSLLPPERPGGGRSNQLRGSGMSDVRLFVDPVDGLPLWSFHSAEYRFLSSGSPNPVPEPASMILLGSGLAGLALRRARTRRAASEFRFGCGK